MCHLDTHFLSTDIDECSEMKPCFAKCNNTVGSHQCICENGKPTNESGFCGKALNTTGSVLIRIQRLCNTSARLEIWMMLIYDKSY